MASALVNKLEGVINIFSLLLQDTINLINLKPAGNGDDQTIDYSNLLLKDGIVKIPNFIGTDLVERLRNKVEDLVEDNPVSVELENGSKFNYRSQGNPSGPDYGMLDIFSVDKLVPEIGLLNKDKLVRLVKNVTGQEVIPFRINAYVNEGISNTRMYHVDNTQPVIYKAFVYLTDVPTIEFGPYSFVKQSHRLSLDVYKNLILNLFKKELRSSDMSIYNKDKVVNATGSRGDLILSNQNGIHRGLPQVDGKKRIAIVFSFLVKSKLSYINSTIKQGIRASSN